MDLLLFSFYICKSQYYWHSNTVLSRWSIYIARKFILIFYRSGHILKSAPGIGSDQNTRIRPDPDPNPWWKGSGSRSIGLILGSWRKNVAVWIRIKIRINNSEYGLLPIMYIDRSFIHPASSWLCWNPPNRRGEGGGSGVGSKGWLFQLSNIKTILDICIQESFSFHYEYF